MTPGRLGRGTVSTVPRNATVPRGERRGASIQNVTREPKVGGGAALLLLPFTFSVCTLLQLYGWMR
jgi:hypothetical protein